MKLNPTVYSSGQKKSVIEALSYTKTHESTHRYLAYRDIPKILSTYLLGKKALDYGTGTGCSAKFLHELNLNVSGADISKEMLDQAKLKYPSLEFYQIENGIIPIKGPTYDLIFSSFVLFEINSPKKIMTYLSEGRRVMKEDGLFVAITGSQDLHSSSKNWLNFYTDFPENKNLLSGGLVKLYLYDSDMEFTDYYWTEADYRSFFNKSGLNLIEVIYPLGYEDELYSWKDEIQYSPFVILVAKKQ